MEKITRVIFIACAIIAILGSAGTIYYSNRANELRTENGSLRRVVQVYIDSDERARTRLLEIESIVRRLAERDKKAAELARRGLELIYGKVAK